MSTAIFSYSQRGAALAEKLAGEVFSQNDCRLYTLKRFCRDGFRALEDQDAHLYGYEFKHCDLLVFIGAAGIAVRKIAPYVKDKKTDPAVVCIDEKGTFVIPFLSGHIGGANVFAREIAAYIDAVPVITTATDVNGKFAVDEWAARCRFIISDMKMAKWISSRILEADIPVCCDFPVAGNWPEGTFPVSDLCSCTLSDTGIYIGYRKQEPFAHTLRIIPPVLRLGIGCRKNISRDKISAAVASFLADQNVDERAVKGICSIDLKAQEPGLLEYCAEKGWQLTTYTAEELKSVKGNFTASAFVEGVTGVDNVCERAAAKEGTLIAGKTSLNGVTCALAAEDLTIVF